MVHLHHDHDGHDHDHDDDEEYGAGPRHFFGAVPVFLVDDVLATVDYYRDVLGFEADFLYGTPPTYASVSRDDAILNFALSDRPGRRNSVSAGGGGNGFDAYLVVADVDDVYIELQEHGANIVKPIANEEYGMREFHLQDLNDYRLAIAEETDDA